MKDWNVSRRELIKSLGVGAAAFPLLHATRALAQSAAYPKRLFVVASGEGMRPFAWPVGQLAGQTLPDTLSPLQPHLGDLLFIPKLRNPSYPGCANCGHGAYGTVYFGGPVDPASGEYKTPAAAGADGFTVNQVVADAFYAKNPTPAKSLALQVEVDTYLADGTTGAHRCFWRGAGQPVNGLMDPFQAYTMYVAGRVMGNAGGTPAGGGAPTGPSPAVMAMLAKKKSILDYVATDLTRFGSRLGTDAQQSIQGHFTAIRDLENTLSQNVGMGPGLPTGPVNFPIDWSMDQAAQSSAACKMTMGFNGATPCFFYSTANYPTVLDLHMKLGVLALASGATQVATLQILDATGDAKSFVWVQGVPGSTSSVSRNGSDLHAISHSPIKNGIDVKQRVDKWLMTQFANLIGYMKSIPEGGKTMLDNSLILWGNHMESGDTHLANALPWMLAGSAGGYFKTGQTGPTLANTNTNQQALVSICNAMGVPPNMAAFGTTPLPGLT